MIIMIISFTKRLLIKLGQRFKFVSCHTVVVSDATGVELFFLSRTVSGSGAARCFCVALPPSPFAFRGSCLETTPKKIEIEQFFF
jgi:hypothetical protein